MANFRWLSDPVLSLKLKLDVWNTWCNPFSALQKFSKNSPVNNSLISTFLCTYCEIWIIASTYFCIFVLLFQNNIKCTIYHTVSPFFLLKKGEKKGNIPDSRPRSALCKPLPIYNSILPQHSTPHLTYRLQSIVED